MCRLVLCFRSMQQSTAELYAVLGCLGDSDLMPNFIVGTVLGQFINLELKVCHHECAISGLILTVLSQSSEMARVHYT